MPSVMTAAQLQALARSGRVADDRGKPVTPPRTERKPEPKDPAASIVAGMERLAAAMAASNAQAAEQLKDLADAVRELARKDDGEKDDGPLTLTVVERDKLGRVVSMRAERAK